MSYETYLVHRYLHIEPTEGCEDCYPPPAVVEAPWTLLGTVKLVESTSKRWKNLPRVGGEQPVRASSDESQQPRDDPARPE